MIKVNDYLITSGGQEGFYIWKYNSQMEMKQ